MMQRARELWYSLFATERPLRYELLLILLLLKVIRESAAAILKTSSQFHSEDLFNPVAVGVNPIGWAEWFPTPWLYSHGFNQAIGLITLMSSLGWLSKRCLPLSAIISTWSYGILVSLRLTRHFNYAHQNLPVVAALVIFAAMYTFRWREISQALRRRSFWNVELYRRWVFVLILVYLGSFYTYSGLTKLALSGMQAGSGLRLQLIFGTTEGLPILARPIVQFRPLVIGMQSGPTSASEIGM